MPRPKLTYSGVVATLALFLALGGGVYAATQLPKNSVGRKQIRKDAVVSSKVKNGSLTSADFKAGQLPRGPAGPEGPAGPQGPAGATGPQGPGAVKLFLDADGDSQRVTLGSVGPWTFEAMCEKAGVVVPVSFKLFVDGPGSLDLSESSRTNDEGAVTTAIRHIDLTADSEVFSSGLKSPDRARWVGTMVLSAGPADPVVTVPFTMLTDEGARHCRFAGTAVPAG